VTVLEDAAAWRLHFEAERRTIAKRPSNSEKLITRQEVLGDAVDRVSRVIADLRERLNQIQSRTASGPLGRETRS